MNNDLYNNVLGKLSVFTLIGNTVTLATGTAVDLAGYESCLIEFIVGTLTGSTLTCSVEAADDANATVNVTTLAAANGLLGTLPIVITAGNDEGVFKVGYVGKQRYVRAIVSAGTNGTFAIHANVLRSAPRNAPV